MTVKTIHEDTHGDKLTIYRGTSSKLIFIDGMFDEDDVAWRGIFTPAQAQSIAMRLITLANIMEGK